MNTKTSSLHAALCLGYALTVLMTVQCSRQDTADTHDRAAPSVAALTSAAHHVQARHAAGTIASAPHSRDRSSVATAVRAFFSRADADAAITAVLASNSVLDQATVSNLLAGLDTEEITRALINTPYEREKLATRSYNYMNMYEEIVRRGSPPWTRLMALSQLMDYYCYHGTTSKELMEKFHRFRDMVAQLTPEDAPDEASMRTFVSLQIGLLGRLDPAYEEVLRRAHYIEELTREQRAPFTQEALEYVAVTRAIALIDLGRPDEARAIIQAMHDKIDKLEGCMTKLEVRDLQDFMDRHMSTRWDLYFEYEQKFNQTHESNK